MRHLLPCLWILATLMAIPASADAPRSPADAQALRALALRIRASGDFKVPLPGTSDPQVHYQFAWGSPLFSMPLVADLSISPGSDAFIRTFYDKILLQDGSSMDFGGQKIPLTCVYVEGEDNTASGDASPLIPQTLLKVYLVANDFTCTGPVNPGWPENGLRRDAWDTYLYFEVRDPTIMMPTEIRVRYRWNELAAVPVTP